MYVKVTRKGQVTIPKVFRDRLNISEGDILLVELKEECIIFRKPKLPSPGEPVGMNKYREILEELEEVRRNWR